jgi:hypothetical protein
VSETMRDGCPTWGPYRFHRYPCPLAGQIDDSRTTPTPVPPVAEGKA